MINEIMKKNSSHLVKNIYAKKWIKPGESEKMIKRAAIILETNKQSPFQDILYYFALY